MVKKIRFFILLVSLFFLMGIVFSYSFGKSLFTEKREQMVQNQIKQRGITDKKVLQAMLSVLRHKFVPNIFINRAYYDMPLPIGYGQTISQPYIVGLMTERLELEHDDKVLEVGTGSGYQAAVLAEICENVYTVEIIPSLAKSARQRLNNLGYDNVKVKNADGYYGWEKYAPFDAIVVTAAANNIPPPLIDQLKKGGRMVIPVGGVFQVQRLMLVTKDSKDKISIENIIPVRFVPLTGKH